MSEKDYKEMIGKASKTQGKKKIFHYFEYLKDTTEFKKYIVAIGMLSDEYYTKCGQQFSNEPEYWDMIAVTCQQFGLPVFSWQGVLHNMIYYPKMKLDFTDPLSDMCKITSHQAEQSRHRFLSDIGNDSYEKEYPVILALNAYASKKDVLDFIEKNFSKGIAPKLNEYKKLEIKIGKIKKRRKLSRDNFIFSNRHLKYAEIDILQKERFGGGQVGYDYIGKIIRKIKKEKGIKD